MARNDRVPALGLDRDELWNDDDYSELPLWLQRSAPPRLPDATNVVVRRQNNVVPPYACGLLEQIEVAKLVVT